MRGYGKSKAGMGYKAKPKAKAKPASRGRKTARRKGY